MKYLLCQLSKYLTCLRVIMATAQATPFPVFRELLSAANLFLWIFLSYLSQIKLLRFMKLNKTLCILSLLKLGGTMV